MAIADMFRPKWKHSDPDVRLAAVRDVGDKEILEDILDQDRNFRVRLAALKKVGDQTVLGRVVARDENESVRLAALSCLNNLSVLRAVAGMNESEKVRLAAVKKIGEPAVLLDIARKNDNPQVRAAAVRQLDDPDLLTELGSKSDCAATALAAIRKLTDPDRLARIATHQKNASVRLAAVSRIRDLNIPIPINQVRAMALPFMAVTEPADPKTLKPYFEAMEKIEDARVLAEVARSGAHYLIRWEAVSRLTDQKVLEGIVAQEPNDRLRLAAVARLKNVEALMGVAMSDERARVRMAAAARLAHAPSLLILCENDPDVRVRIQGVCRLRDPQLLEHVSKMNSLPAVREAAEARINRTKFAARVIKAYPDAFYAGRKSNAEGMGTLTRAEIRPLMDPALQGAVAVIDERKACVEILTTRDPQKLVKMATNQESPLLRLAAVNKINSPRVLLALLTRLRKRIPEGGLGAPNDDMTRFAVLEKLGDPGLCESFGLTRKYVKTINDRTVLTGIMSSEAFEDLRIIAENRYENVVYGESPSLNGTWDTSRPAA